MEITEKEIRDIVRSELEVNEGLTDFSKSPVLKALGLVGDSGQPDLTALPNAEQILDPGSTGETTVDSYVLKDMSDLYMRLVEIIGNLFAGRPVKDADGNYVTQESVVLTASKEKTQENLAVLEKMAAEYEEKMQNLANTGRSLSQDEFDAAESELTRIEKQIEDLAKETEALPQNQGQLITKLVDKYFKKSFDLDEDGQIGDVDDLQMALSSMLDGENFLAGTNVIDDIVDSMKVKFYDHDDYNDYVRIEEQETSGVSPLYTENKVTYKMRTLGASAFVNAGEFREEVNRELAEAFQLTQSDFDSSHRYQISQYRNNTLKTIEQLEDKRRAEFENHLVSWFDYHMNSNEPKTYKLSIQDGELIATYQVILLLPLIDFDTRPPSFTWYTEHDTPLGSRSKESNLSLMHSLCDIAKSSNFPGIEDLGLFGLKKSYKYKLDLPPVYGEFVERNAEWAKYTKEIEKQMADIAAIAPEVPKIEIGKNYSEEEMQDIVEKVALADDSDLYVRLLNQYQEKYNEFIAQSQSTSALEGFRYIRDTNKPLPFKWTEMRTARRDTYAGEDVSGGTFEELGLDMELAKKTTKLFCEYIESQNASYLKFISEDPMMIDIIASEKEAAEKRREVQAARRKEKEERKQREAERQEELKRLRRAREEEERARLEALRQKREAGMAQRSEDLKLLGPDVVMINDIKSFVPSLHSDGQDLFDDLLDPQNITGLISIMGTLGDPNSTELRQTLKGIRTMLRNLEKNDELQDVTSEKGGYPDSPQYRRLKSIVRQAEELSGP